MAPRLQSRHVLLLGASGKIGRLVRKVWAVSPPKGLTITPVQRDGGNSGDGGAIRWSPGMPMADLPPADVVMALWGVTPGPGRDLGENVALAETADAVARHVGADTVVHCSTAAVYAPGPAALKESAPIRPLSAYGAAKARMEEVIQAAPRPGPARVILRIGNVMGAESLGASLRRGGPVTIDGFAEGHGPARSYVSASDLARVLQHLALRRAEIDPTILNVAAAHPTAMAAIARAAGREVRWRPAGAGAMPLLDLDSGALQRLCALPPFAWDADYLVADARRWDGAI